jgi:lipoate synthase
MTMATTIPRAAAWLRIIAGWRPGSTRRRAREALAAALRAEQLAHVLVQVVTADGSEQAGASYADPVVARIQARRRRIEASGLVLHRGGAA